MPFLLYLFRPLAVANETRIVQRPWFVCTLIVMAIYNLVLIALSIFFIGLIPSMAGISIGNTNALRIRLYKYDYLEEHPEITGRQRKKIPWEELIYEDRETLGPRTFRSFLFPWKDGQNLDR